jgi:hypothetical protein
MRDIQIGCGGDSGPWMASGAGDQDGGRGGGKAVPRKREEMGKARRMAGGGPAPRRLHILHERNRLKSAGYREPYPAPSDEVMLALETRFANTGFCSVARSEPLMISTPRGCRLLCLPQRTPGSHDIGLHPAHDAISHPALT